MWQRFLTNLKSRKNLLSILFQGTKSLESVRSWNHSIRLFYCDVYDKETVDNFRGGTRTLVHALSVCI